jgi:hypothetical protein
MSKRITDQHSPEHQIGDRKHQTPPTSALTHIALNVAIGERQQSVSSYHSDFAICPVRVDDERASSDERIVRASSSLQVRATDNEVPQHAKMPVQIIVGEGLCVVYHTPDQMVLLKPGMEPGLWVETSITAPLMRISRSKSMTGLRSGRPR